MLIFQPTASLREIQKVLENSKEEPLHLDLNYVGKLRDRIFAERTRRNDHRNLKVRLAEIQDEHKAIKTRLWREATDPRSPAVARIMALDKLAKSELELLSAEMDAGLYERKIGTIDVKHEHALAPDMLAPIILALQNYGIVDRKKVEPIQEDAARPTLPSPSGGNN